jgi:glycosyltransferase involved in cell wall biosynthesis
MENTEKKIILFYDSAEVYGGHQVMSLYAINFFCKSTEYDCHIIVSNKNHILSEKVRKIDNLKVHLINGNIARFQAFFCYFRTSLYSHLKKIISDIQPNFIITLQGTIETSNEIIPVAKKFNVPIICYIPLTNWLKNTSRHKRIGAIRDKLDTRIYNSIDYFITINQEMKEYICQRGVQESNIFVNINGVDFSRLKRLPKKEVKEKYGIFNDKYIFSIVGRVLFLQKGQNYIVKMLSKYKQDFEDCLFVVAGDGGDFANIKKMIKENQLERYFKLLGNVSEPNEIYSFTDTLVIPSIYEGTPLVLYEGLYMGCKVCGNDIPPIRFQLSKECIFKNEDLESIRNTLLYVKNNRVQCLDDSESFFQKYNMERFQKNFWDIFNEITELLNLRKV